MHEKTPESQRSELGFFRSIPRRWVDDKLMVHTPAWLNWVMLLIGLAMFTAEVWLVWSAIQEPTRTYWFQSVIWWLQTVVLVAFFAFVSFAEARGLIVRARRRPIDSSADPS